MHEQRFRWLAILAMLVMVGLVCGGTWTPNNFFYKPDIGARGQADKNLFDAGFGRVDVHLGKYKTLGDPGYEDIATAISTVGSDEITLTIPAGEVLINNDLEIPSNLHLRVLKGGCFKIADTKTLTLTECPEAGPYQIFSWTGTGAITFSSSGSVREIPLAWFGPNKNGSTTDSAIIQKAIGSLTHGKISLESGSYALGSAVQLKEYVCLSGVGDSTIFIPTANANAFEADANIIHSSFYPLMENCAIDASSNGNDINLIYFDYYLKNAVFHNVNFIGNPSAAQCGVYAEHTRPGGSANQVYRNLWRGCSFNNLRSFSHDGGHYVGGSVYLKGASGRRANENRWEHCAFSNYRIGINIGGIGNSVYACTVNEPITPIQKENPAGANGTDVAFYCHEGYDNTTYSTWFESQTSDVVSIGAGRNDDNSSVAWMHFMGIGLNGADQVPDLASDRIYPATYSSGTEFTVSGDQTSEFTEARVCWVFQGTDGWKHSKVASSSYTTETTVTLDDSILTSNLTTAYLAPTIDRRAFISGDYRHLPALAIGDEGTPLRKVYVGSVDVAPGSIGANSTDTATADIVAWAKTNNPILVSVRGALTSGVVLCGARVNNTGSIRAKFANITSNPIDPGTVTLDYIYIQD